MLGRKQYADARVVTKLENPLILSGGAPFGCGISKILSKGALSRLTITSLDLAFSRDAPTKSYPLLTLEHESRVGSFRFSPYGSVEGSYDATSYSAEGSYDNPQHIWDQWWYTAGVQLPYESWFMLQAYYRRENCSTCTPASWNVGGITVNFFLNDIR